MTHDLVFHELVFVRREITRAKVADKAGTVDDSSPRNSDSIVAWINGAGTDATATAVLGITAGGAVEVILV